MTPAAGQVPDMFHGDPNGFQGAVYVVMPCDESAAPHEWMFNSASDPIGVVLAVTRDRRKAIVQTRGMVKIKGGLKKPKNRGKS